MAKRNSVPKRECQQMLEEFEHLGLVEKVLDAEGNVVRRNGLVVYRSTLAARRLAERSGSLSSKMN